MAKTLKFRHNLVKDILDGRKTATWRLFDDKDLRVGDILELIDWESKKEFAKAEIIGLTEKKLGEVERSDFKGHEKFENKQKMLDVYREYYGDRTDWNTVVKIIEFKIL